ncbi:MAG: hypothetical protein J2P23_14130 [Microlunatus sp.]|nr:hypothetical protein [Microlunatus sp.]
MRRTVTLDPEVELRLSALMEERGLTFKEALNSALRSALELPSTAGAEFPSFDMGTVTVDLTHSGRIAASIEDEEILRRLAAG